MDYEFLFKLLKKDIKFFCLNIKGVFLESTRIEIKVENLNDH